MNFKTFFIAIVLLVSLGMIVSSKELVFSDTNEITINIDLINGTSVWNESGSNVLPQDATLGIRVTTLISCDTIDTDSSGVFSCGNDATGDNPAKFGNENFTVRYGLITTTFDNENFTTRYDLRTDRFENINLTQLGNVNINTSGSLNVSGNVTFTQLISCDTINTDSNGLLTCGDDAGSSDTTLGVDYVGIVNISGEITLNWTTLNQNWSTIQASRGFDNENFSIRLGTFIDAFFRIGNWTTLYDNEASTRFDNENFTTQLSNLNSSLWNQSGTNTFLKFITDNVGIGTINPAYTLTVAGNVNVSTTLNVSGNVSFTQLLDCDTINTDATGLLTCGDDATGGGGGAAGLWGTNTTQITVNTSLTGGIINVNVLGNLSVGNTTKDNLSLTMGFNKSSFNFIFTHPEVLFNYTGNATFSDDITVDGTIFGTVASPAQPVKIAGINVTNNVISYVENRNQSSRFTFQNLNSGTNASAVIEAINDMGASIFFGIGSRNFMLGDIGSPNITALISRSRGDMIFANSFKEKFIWYNNPQDDNDLNNLVELMKLDDSGLNITENLTINGVLILPNNMQLSPSQSSVLRRDDSSGVIGAQFGIQGSDVGETDHRSGASYVWIVENGTLNYTVDLHGSLDPQNPNQVVHHLRGNITGEVWRLDNPQAEFFRWETKINGTPLLIINRTGLFIVNNSFFITSAGNVGIGTKTPKALLDINGQLRLSGFLGPASDTFPNVTQAKIIIYNNSNTNFAVIGADTGGNTWFSNKVGGDYDFWSGETHIVKFDNSGNVGIGTTTPLSSLDVVGNFTIHEDNTINFVNVTTNAVGFTEIWNGTCLIQRNLISGNNWTKC